MTKMRKKLWSITRVSHPRYPGIQVRISEIEPGGSLYAIRMIEGKQRMASLRIKRADLGATRKEQEEGARAEAFGIIENLATGGPLSPNGTPVSNSEPAEIVTFRDLVDLYEAHGLYGRSENYKKEQPAKVRRIAKFLGEDRDVRSLSRSDVEAFSAHRKVQGARQGTIASDLAALKIALNWATEHRRPDGQPLVEQNPLAKVKIKQEIQPRRPVAGEDRYRALRAVSDQVSPSFSLALDLAWTTGRRIAAIQHLTWSDCLFDPSEAAALAASLDSGFGWTAAHFPYGGIRWYRDRVTTNKVSEQVVPMSAVTRHALERARPDIAPPGTLIFPSPKDPSRPLWYTVFRDGLLAAEKLAGLPHIRGGGWHALRRGWATLRKHHPPQDVARAGGWRDTETLVRCYARADAAAVLAVINGPPGS